MKRKLIGAVEVVNGKAEYLWDIDEDIPSGNYKVYVGLYQHDGYLLGEQWENAFIKIPTTTMLGTENIYVDSTVIPREPETMTLTAIVQTSNTFEPVSEGLVQFQVKTEDDSTFVNVGMPVEVIDGTAQCEYEIPEKTLTTIYAKATYYGTTDYSTSESYYIEKIHVRGRVSLNTSNICANAGRTKSIVTTISDSEDSSAISEGMLEYYLDDELIYSIENITSDTITFEYMFPIDMQSGEHILRTDYIGTDRYSSETRESLIEIGSFVIIDDSTVHAPQSYIDNGEIIQGVVTVPIRVTSPDRYGVAGDEVVFFCNGTTENMRLDENGEAYATVRIPLGARGGDEIPFIVTYLETGHHQTTIMQSRIIVKSRTNLELLGFKRNVGEGVTVSTLVTDEYGADVDEGSVIFEMDSDATGFGY